MVYSGAYLVRGDEHTLAALQKEKGIDPANPDNFVRAYRKFGIDEAHEIRSRSALRAVSGDRRVFLLSVPSMTTEAQNALLKTIEEPSADAVFYFVTPSPESLLPTIRSRTQILEVKAPMSRFHLDRIDADDFLAAAPEKRITMLKPLYEHPTSREPGASSETGEYEGRDIGSVIAFLAALERRFAKAKKTPENEAGIHAIYRARKYATDKGSLLKALLEQVALLAPRM